jgi:Fe2+ or Zn2+ uptake regulation protein
LIRSISRRSGFSVREHWLQLFGLYQTCQARAAATRA